MTQQIEALNFLIEVGEEYLEATGIDANAFRNELADYMPHKMDDWECGVIANSVNVMAIATAIAGEMPRMLMDDDGCPYCQVLRPYKQCAWDYVKAELADASPLQKLSNVQKR